MAKKRIYYNEFRRSLDAEPLKPVYLFTGAEAFLQEQGVQAIIEKALEPSERQMNLEILYAGTDVTGRALVERAQTLPFLGQRRVLVVRQADKWKNADLESMTHYAQSPAESSVVILASPEERLKTQPWNKLADKAYHVECYPLFDNQVPSWVERRIADHGKRISREALPLLIEKVGQHLGDLDNEIIKLVNYVGQEMIITEDHVKAAAGDLRHETTYALNTACGLKDLSRAFNLAERVLEEGLAPLQVLGSLTWHFRNLYQLKSKLSRGNEAAKVLAGYRNPQAKKEMEQQLQAYKLEEFNQVFTGLLDLDVRAKSGDQHWLMALQLTIMKWCGQKRSPAQSSRA